MKPPHNLVMLSIDKRLAEEFCINNAECVLAYRIYIEHIIALIDAGQLDSVAFYSGAYAINSCEEEIGRIIDKAQYARRTIKTNYLHNMAMFTERMDTRDGLMLKNNRSNIN